MGTKAFNAAVQFDLMCLQRNRSWLLKYNFCCYEIRRYCEENNYSVERILLFRTHECQYDEITLPKVQAIFIFYFFTNNSISSENYARLFRLENIIKVSCATSGQAISYYFECGNTASLKLHRGTYGHYMFSIYCTSSGNWGTASS